MRILGTFVILCAIFCTACGYIPTNHEASVAVSVENSYDAGIAAYKRGHYQAALYDFELRANQGDPVAQFCLGFMYSHRQIPIPKKFQEEATEWYTANAQEWYTKAAEQDYLPAQNNLGVMSTRLYEKSKGKNSKALEDAEKWFQKAATNGYPPGQLNFAILTEVACYCGEMDQGSSKPRIPSCTRLPWRTLLSWRWHR